MSLIAEQVLPARGVTENGDGRMKWGYTIKELFMKKILSIFILSGLLLTGCYNTGEPRGKVLKIYNWADYIGEGV